MSIFLIGIGALFILAIIAAIATKFTKRKAGEPDIIMPTSGDVRPVMGQMTNVNKYA